MKDESILQYTPAKWEKAFKSEKDNLLFCLPNFKVTIEHIGATAVNSCRSFRNVDILLSTHDYGAVSTIAMVLKSKEYKELKELSTLDCIVLVKKSKVYGCGITLRIVQYASMTYRRITCFKIFLKESYDCVQRYNIFREAAIKTANFDIKEYNKMKYNYINSILDERFRFE